MDYKKKIKGSIALRAFYVSLILLAIPLLVHNFFMYRKDYNQRKKDLFLSLNILADARTTLVEQLILSDTNLVELVSTGLLFENHKKTNEINPILNNYLKRVSEDFNAAEVFYLSKLGNQLICTASSEPTLLEKDFTSYVFFSEQLQNSQFAFLGVLPDTDEKRFFIGKTLLNEFSEPLGLIIASAPAISLAHRLAAIEDSPYLIDLSLLMNEGLIFASSNPQLSMRSVGASSADLQRLRENGQIGDLKIFSGEVLIEPVQSIANAFVLTDREKNFAVIAPIQDTDISIILDVSERRVFAQQQREYFFEFLTLLLIIVVVGGGVTFLLTLRISRPLKNLHKAMASVATGNLKARFEEDRMGFEINELGKHFNHMIDSILKHQKEAQKARMAEEILAQELKIAYEIQISLFPSYLPELPGLDISAGFQPAKQVGGDFYDLFLRDDGKLVITIADTAGKGISACLYSLGIRSILRSFANISEELDQIIISTNKLFCRDTTESSMFVTAWVGIYDPSTEKLEYCSVGHHPGYLKRKDGDIEELKTQGIAFGVEIFDEVEVKTVRLDKGDLLLLFTDGVVEAEDRNKKLYGAKKLKDFLSAQENSEAKIFIQKLLSDIRQFSGSEEYSDDVTIVTMRLL